MDHDTLEMLHSSLRHVLTEDSGASLAKRLDELGWDEVVADDASTAMRTLFEVKGDTLSSADALGPQLSKTLADSTGDEQLAAATIALPSPFGPSTCDAGNGLLSVEAMTLSSAGLSSVTVVPIGSTPRLAVIRSENLTMTPFTGMDEWFRAHRLSGDIEAHGITWIDDDLAAAAWNAVVAQGRWLLSCELTAIGRHVLVSAAKYTGERVQYGRPIGTFQALQHRLASAHALVVGAGHLAKHAGESGDEWSALVAKAMAGRAAEFACSQAQQCYGAIGFTWEHEFHRYLKRAYTLDRLFGDWRSLEFEIGRRLQGTGVVPHIGSL